MWSPLDLLASAKIPRSLVEAIRLLAHHPPVDGGELVHLVYFRLGSCRLIGRNSLTRAGVTDDGNTSFSQLVVASHGNLSSATSSPLGTIHPRAKLAKGYASCACAQIPTISLGKGAAYETRLPLGSTSDIASACSAGRPSRSKGGRSPAYR